MPITELIQNPALCPQWRALFAEESKKPYFSKLLMHIEAEYASKTVFPPKSLIFNALMLTPLSEVKVVILGQDPYHDTGQAHGLSFSVPQGIKVPPSLSNMYKELAEDMGCPIPGHGNLEAWAKQGVLLLNTVLTVRAHEANSHAGLGWELLTDAIIAEVSKQDRPVVFFLWGKPAQKKSVLCNNPRHLVVQAPHPSPLSSYRGFFGSKPYSKANAFLHDHNVKAIDWTQGV